ncbi:MAG: hypothetical protein EHM41_13110 [Chloroflexi bacterium]|nr:MAG: hypothetical protein EHM41_13110 [Chloroflexota bacterium]
MNQRAGLPLERAVYILRLWRNSPKGRWIVEIQNVKTGAVTHISGLEAIIDYLEESIQTINNGAEKSK